MEELLNILGPGGMLAAIIAVSSVAVAGIYAAMYLPYKLEKQKLEQKWEIDKLEHEREILKLELELMKTQELPAGNANNEDSEQQP
jgi:cell division protein FtsB